MDYRIQREIAPGVFTAFEDSTSSSVVIVSKDEEGNLERKSSLSFSASFIQQFDFDYCTFHHLHGYNDGGRLFSVVFDQSFSQHIEFELCFDSIEAKKNGELKGTIGTIEFFGSMRHQYGYYNAISVIPIKYIRVVHGEEFYTAAYNGKTWDIYDNFHFERDKQIQDERFGDYELVVQNAYCSPDKGHYLCSLEGEYEHRINPDSNNQFLVLSRVLLSGIKKIAEHTDEPYPVSNSGMICLIGCPRYSEEYEYDTVSKAWRLFSPLFAKYSYIVSRNGKKGLWFKNGIVLSKMQATHNYSSKCDFYGQGYEELACDYLDIIPNQENLLDGGEDEPLGSCNSFSIKCESGWGVYDVKKQRTVLTPVFDGPATVIIGPEGYINSFNGKYGIVDKNGNIVFPFIYDKISIINVETQHFEDGWAIRTDVQLELNGEITQKRFSFDYF